MRHFRAVVDPETGEYVSTAETEPVDEKEFMARRNDHKDECYGLFELQDGPTTITCALTVTYTV